MHHLCLPSIFFSKRDNDNLFVSHYQLVRKRRDVYESIIIPFVNRRFEIHHQETLLTFKDKTSYICEIAKGLQSIVYFPSVLHR